MDGWIKLHRKLVDWKYYKNSEILHVFIHLVLSANHKEGYTKDGTKILRGQLMTSNKALSEKTGLDESKVFRIVEKLKIEEQIEKRSNRQNTIITIVNYDDYQSDEERTAERVKNGCRTSEERVKTNKNNNNNKNEKKRGESEPSPLEAMFSEQSIVDWLRSGSHSIQSDLLATYDHEYLRAEVYKAYHWNVENKKNRKSGTFLLSWLQGAKNPVLKGGISSCDKPLLDFFNESGVKPQEI